MQFLSRTTRALALTGGLAVLAACSTETSFLQSEAGAELASTGFGETTQNNVLVHSGARSAMFALGQRFDSEVPSMVNFDFNSATLDPAAQTALRRQADWIRQFPEVRFRVYGHTDLVGSSAYNQRLGLRRAQAVVAYLTAQGIDRTRLEAVASFGETRPLIATSEPERRNRRTVTEVTGFVKANPSVLDGRYSEIIYREYVTSATEQSTVEEADTGGAGE
jgi:outer membrane protein OmpA-like peptidoglycan-associated protein